MANALLHRERPQVEPIAVRRLEAARLLNVSIRTLDDLIAKGAIPCKRVGRIVLFSTDELRRWLLEGTR